MLLPFYNFDFEPFVHFDEMFMYIINNLSCIWVSMERHNNPAVLKNYLGYYHDLPLFCGIMSNLTILLMHDFRLQHVFCRIQLLGKAIYQIR